MVGVSVPSCGSECGRVHDTRPKRIRDLTMSGRRVTLVGGGGGSCAATAEPCTWRSIPSSRGDLTRRLVRQLAADARVMTIPAAGRREGWDGAR